MASLSGRADATLVKAATDAAMANVPVDVSRINERVSRSYTAMTQSVGKSWGNALKSIGEIGGALMQNAKEKKDDIGKPFENTNVDARKYKLAGDNHMIYHHLRLNQQNHQKHLKVFKHYPLLIMLIKTVILQPLQFQTQMSFQKN